MAITVSWPDDPINFPRVITSDGQGRTMTQTALVQGTDDIAVAIIATGIPRVGDQWGSSSGLFRTTAEATRWGGADHQGNNTGGACKVKCARRGIDRRQGPVRIFQGLEPFAREPAQHLHRLFAPHL